VTQVPHSFYWNISTASRKINHPQSPKKMLALFVYTIFLVIVVWLTRLISYYIIVRPFWNSSLDQIPNAHFTSPVSYLWILWIRFWDQERLVVNEAHLKHGPIVRLGPKDLSVSCYDNGIRVIYGGGFDKHEFYNFYLYYG
jgi:hypothetical protein